MTAAPESERTIYLGMTAEHEFVWAELRFRRKPGSQLTIEHEEVSNIPTIGISFVIAGPKFRGNPYDFAADPELMNHPRFDAVTHAWGQVGAEDRIITDRSSMLDGEEIAFLEQAWERWHLNDLRAGCAHMPAYADIVVPEDYEGERYDYSPQSRKQGWAIKNVVCSAGTGYRWGTSWLVEVPPADVIDRFVELVTGV